MYCRFAVEFGEMFLEMEVEAYIQALDLDNEMKTCKEKFKEFEKQDVKYREDFKHMKHKIKKLSDKIDMDSSKISEIEKENEKSSSLIPKIEEEIPKLQEQLVDEETILEGIIESAKGETEKHRTGLTKVHAELEPWESQIDRA